MCLFDFVLFLMVFRVCVFRVVCFTMSLFMFLRISKIFVLVIPDLTDKSLSTLVNSMDYLLENDWLTISGGILGLIIWLSSFLSAIIGASFWDSLEWVKGKTEGNTCFTLL